MKNGIYLFVVLFLGVMGYFVVNDLMMKKSFMLAAGVFFVFSIVITMLITHYKKRVEQTPAEKVLNITYVGIFALYGFVVGISLLYLPPLEIATVGYEGFIFIAASLALLYGIYKYYTTKVMLGHY